MKLIRNRVNKIADALKGGATIELACKIGRISRQTFWDWQKAGKTLFEAFEGGERQKKEFSDREKLLCEFYEKTSASEAEYELSLLKEIRESPHRWQALAWILERRFRERYAQRVMVDTDLFVKRFGQENTDELTGILQKIIDRSEIEKASRYEFEEEPLKGKALAEAAGIE